MPREMPVGGAGSHRGTRATGSIPKPLGIPLKQLSYDNLYGREKFALRDIDRHSFRPFVSRLTESAAGLRPVPVVGEIQAKRSGTGVAVGYQDEAGAVGLPED